MLFDNWTYMAIPSQQTEKCFRRHGMKIAKRSNKLMRTIFLGFTLLLAVPAVSLAQGRGHGRGHGPDMDKKCGKFVNCHDARDGRWDGRGPNRGTRVSDLYGRRRYRRVIDDDIIYSRSRIRRDRDGDGDFDRNDIRLERQRRLERRYRRWNP
jgi:hypothetical protein